MGITSSGINRVLDAYALPAPVRWEAVGQNCNIRCIWAGTKSPSHYLKLYPALHYSHDHVHYEAEIVRQLCSEGISAASPVPNREGRWVTDAGGSLGRCWAAVYERAPGRTIPGDQLSLEQCRAFGRLAGETHRAMDAVAIPYPLRRMDLIEVLDRPLAIIGPLLNGLQRADLTCLAARLRELLAGMSLDSPYFGLCHGDLYAANVAFDDNNRPTLFDFQSMEYGWRANDLAQFLWRAGRSWNDPDRANRLARWEAFVRGYEEVRPLTPQESNAVAAFVPTRVIWYIGFRLRRGQQLDCDYFSSRIAFVNSWMCSFELW